MSRFCKLLFLLGTVECDHGNGSYNVAIPAGVITFKYNLPILDDDLYETDEKLKVEITSSNHSQIKISGSGNTADVIIVDDEERE